MCEVSDCHGSFYWMLNGCLEDFEPEETAIIILGDAGINFWLDKKDTRLKEELESRKYYLYCVRGNHEERPENIPTMQLIYDDNVSCNVWIEEKYPHIRYFQDYCICEINGFIVGIIGGAYSVDKNYRLIKAGVFNESNPDYFNPQKTGWFPQEQLNAEELKAAAQLFKTYPRVDFMFTHTCPIDWEPIDLFLGGINQSTVDKSMELALAEIRDSMSWGIWCFGHFHADRLERPHVEQYYHDLEDLTIIKARWDNYDLTCDLPWYMTRSPNFFK